MSCAANRPVRSLSTCAAITSSARQPLQIWRVRSSGSRPWRQLTSSGWMPVAYSPANSRSKLSRSSSTARSVMKPSSMITKPSRRKRSTWSSLSRSGAAASTLKFYHRSMPGLADQPLGRLLGFVAATDPAPGGGSSAAVAAALGAALLEMAAGLADETAVAQRAAELRAAALELADRELASYAPVLEALRLPEQSPERADRIAEARGEPSQTPLAIAEVAAEAAQLGAQVSAASKPAIRV